MKKIISIFLSMIIVFGTGTNAFSADSNIENDVIKDTAGFIYQTVKSPQFGSIGGEWAILGLARSGTEIPDAYFETYYKNLEDHVRECGGALHERKYTEYARVVVALTAIGMDPADVAGYNLLTPLGDYDKTIWQGLNGPIWALIALDCGDYAVPQNPEAKIQATREQYVNRILECEILGGGWALSETAINADPDVTAMALVALSNYQKSGSVHAAIARGLNKLSAMQEENGGFSSYDNENSESTAQVLTAISELGISYRDQRFVKNGNTLLDALLSFYTPGEGFAHLNTDGSNLMATEQCLYALVAAQRCANNSNRLFDMSDSLKIKKDENTFGLPGKNADVICPEVKYPDKTFEDIDNHANQAAIEALSARAIISGKTPDKFCPGEAMTRAEFATIVVKALGVPIKGQAKFYDVKSGDWFFDYVNTAYHYGVVNGISETEFNPNGIITREEAAVMLTRAAALCGLETDMELFAARNILAEYIDYVTISDWAATSVAFCCSQQIFDRGEIEINPQKSVTRAEIAQMLYNMLGKAELI